MRPLPLLLILLGGIGLANAQELAPNPKLRGYDPNGGDGKTIYAIPIDGEIDLGLAAFVERIVKTVEPHDRIVLLMNTPGGRVDAAVRIKDALLAAKAPTVTWVYGEAISAGAFIALSTDTIIMKPGTTLGDVMPVQQGEGGEMKASGEKVVTYMRAQMRSVAEAKGRRKDLAEAMVDPDVEIPGVKPKGKLLTLTAEEALKLKMAEAGAESYEQALQLLNLAKAKRVATETLWAEKVARVLTNSLVSSLLMTFGFLGLLMELYTPGFGLAGGVGLVCLALFFLGQYSASLAGWEELIILGIGFVLLALEIFVVPGFGVAGVLGIAAIGAALVMALMEIRVPLDVSFELGYVQEAAEIAAIRIALAVAVLIAGAFAFAKYFPQSKLGSWMVFKAPVSTGGRALGPEAPGGSLPESYEHLIGARGVAHSVLRPAGVAMINGRRVHVVTDGEYLDKGTEIVVSEVDGARVVVRSLNEAQPA